MLKGTTSFCSKSCAVSYSNRKSPRPTEQLSKGHPTDELSPFRWFLGQAQKSGKPTDLTLSDLKTLWEDQAGICPYTKWPLKIRQKSSGKLDRTPDVGSLDRIDSSRGYVKGNVQFIALIAQFAKNSWPVETLFSFCEAVASNNKGG
jgi:hypothetical protein